MDELGCHLSRVSDLKGSVMRGLDPGNPNQELAYGEAYADRLLGVTSELRQEITAISRTLRREYLEARHRDGDEAPRTQSLRFDLGLAQQARRDLEQFEEHAVVSSHGSGAGVGPTRVGAELGGRGGLRA